MQSIIAKIFDALALVFDKIPGLNKIKGARSMVGLLGLAVVAGLQAYNVGSPEILKAVWDGLLVFTGLALLVKKTGSVE